METLKKKALFWDVVEINPEKNRNFIIERILNFGDKEDFVWAMNFYGEKAVKERVLKSKNLDKKSCFFWCQYFNLRQRECLKRQSVQKQSWFWKK